MDKGVIKEWEEGRVKFAIKYVDFGTAYPGHYCGYCTFPQRFTVEEGYSGFLTYVPAHGGLTYTREEESGEITYGFDCGHAGDEQNEHLRDLAWLSWQCEAMALAIIMARRPERIYLLAKALPRKCRLWVQSRVIDRYLKRVNRKVGLEQKEYSFGVCLNLLTGEL